MIYNIELEQSVLGTLILDNDIFPLLNENLFYAPQHQAIFGRIAEILIGGDEVHQASLVHFFANNSLLAEVGGRNYLSTLLTTADSFLVKQHIKALRDLAEIRNFVELSNEIKKATEEAKNPREIKELIQERLEQTSFNELKEPKDVYKLVDEVLKKAEQPRKDLLDLGYAKLDKIIGGIYDGALITLAGGTGMGKSAFGLCVALNVATKYPVLLFSLEMGNDQYASRIISNIASVNTYRLKRGDLNSYEKSATSANVERFKNIQLKIDDESGISVQQIKYKIKKQKVKPRLVIIDLLNILKPDTKQQSREREISSITGALKVLARELNIPILLLAHINREIGKRQLKKPILADLKDSSSIEQDSDLVLFVHRDEYYLNQQKPQENDPSFHEWNNMMKLVQGKATVIVAKNRDGFVGEVEFKFDPEFSRFVETN